MAIFQLLPLMRLLLAASMVIWLFCQAHQGAWTQPVRSTQRMLFGVALVALLLYFNLLHFHGPGALGVRTFVHWHELAHHYLGAKYYGELGYTGLYPALLLAATEANADMPSITLARDLHTYALRPVQEVLAQGAAVKAHFTPPRWAAFQRDVAFFCHQLGDDLTTFWVDHGFNPSPLWALIGGWFVQWTPTSWPAGVQALALLDLVVLTATFGFVGWAFGWRALWLAVIFGSLLFGAQFNWTGGAFLRHLWFLGVVAGFCLLQRRRYAWAGSLFALATLLRVFPLFFVLPIGLKATAIFLRHHRLPRRYWRFFGAFLFTAALLLALTGLLPRGWAHWVEFQTHMATYTRNIATNQLGLTTLLLFPWQMADLQVTWAEFVALKAWRQSLYAGQLVLGFVPLLLAVALRSRRYRDGEITIFALPLLFVGLNLAAYNAIFLVLLVLLFRHAPQRLALLFAAEAVSYALALLIAHQGILFFYHNLTIALLFLALDAGANAPTNRRLSALLAAIDRTPA